MRKERSIDLLITFMNVVAIAVLVGILSVMVTTADANNSGAGRLTVIENSSAR